MKHFDLLNWQNEGVPFFSNLRSKCNHVNIDAFPSVKGEPWYWINGAPLPKPEEHPYYTQNSWWWLTDRNPNCLRLRTSTYRVTSGEAAYDILGEFDWSSCSRRGGPEWTNDRSFSICEIPLPR